ncbi:Uncharacterized protein Adt_41707 [Abeliophyllum distichum]|uniref:Uncharacterized protein n=1 Tax=Abeliophyllum distichum TaxID=126358 RepID=A0ABD1PPK9_9LAMI
MERLNRNQPQQPVQPSIHEIDTIIGGLHPSGNSNNSKKIYIREAKEPANVNYHLHTHPAGTLRSDSITFSPFDAVGVHFFHNDALVVRAVLAINGMERMLVDDKSSINIIYGTTYEKMGIETHLTPAIDPIYEMEETPTTIRNSLEYLIADKSFSYHGVLTRLALIDLACYTNAMRKFVDREIHVIDVEMRKALTDPERIDVGPKRKDEHMRELEDPKDLDSRVKEVDPRTSLVEKLKCFPVDTIDPTKELKLES